MLFVASCHGNQPQAAANASDQAQQEQASSDPAAVNLAPAVYNTGAPSDAAAAAQNPQSAPPPPDYADNGSQPYDDSADESDYGVQPDETASEPPPPMPDYDQPPCPGDDYIWTPGYWDYAPMGYYWVPGAWVEAPYEGALWTPGYWAYSRNRYVFFHGYWGPHIGFYGGVNYGFGYTGIGYQGGYWNRGHFAYNRSVNNINISVVHNVYNYRVANVNNRVSFNGGSGGIQVRPRPAEIAALREPHAPPMHTQMDVRQAALNNHGQFATANRGRPQQFTSPRPVTADHNVRPAPTQGLRNLPPERQARQNPVPMNGAGPGRAEQSRPETNQQQPYRQEPNQPQYRQGQNRPEPNQPQYRQEPNRPEPNQAQPYRAEPNRPGQAPSEPNHPEPEHRNPNYSPPAHSEVRPMQPNQPEPARTEPGRREAPPEPRTAPNHPMPEGRAPAPEQRAAPSRPAPEQHASPPQQDQHRQAPPEHKDDHPHA